MSQSLPIQVNNLWKRYGLPFKPAAERMIDRLRGKPADKFDKYGPWALRDVSFEVKQGEVLGVIGRNGAGKSTLLKVLAGVSPVTSGDVRVAGRVFPMIELNAGLNQELTGRENIYLLGAIMGLSNQQIQRRYDEIADFSELEEWLEKPVWQYSSGMRARIGFAVAMNADANILLIDEILAVGDIAFKKKCYGHIEYLTKQGVAIVFVSHTIRQIERLSDSVLYLEQGAVKGLGEPDAVCMLYHEDTTDHYLKHTTEILQEGYGKSSGDLYVTEVQVLNEDREPTETFVPSDTVILRFEYESVIEVENPVIMVKILNSDTMVVADLVPQQHRDIGDFRLSGHDYFEVTIPRLPLLPDSYFIGIIIRANNWQKLYQGFQIAHFNVTAHEDTRWNRGLVRIDHEWRLPQSKQSAVEG